MADPAVLLSATEADLKDQVAEVRRLQARCEEKEGAWQQAARALKADAKAIWDASREQLKSAQEILLGQLSSRGIDAETKRKIDELHQDNKETKKARSQIYLSAIGHTEFATMGSNAGLSYKDVELRLMDKKEGTEGFGWDDRLEKAQADKYMPHLKRLIKMPRNASWVDAANRHPSLLSYDCEPTLGKNVRGTTDVAVCTRGSVKTYSPQIGIRLAMELKKKVDSAAIAQARATLLLANFHAPHLKPVVVLSDLNEDWLLFWLSNKTVYQTSLETRAQAVNFIQSFLSSELAAPEPDSGEVDINARIEIPEAMLYAQAMDANLADQVETMEAVGTAEDVRQLKLQSLMSLIYAAPSRPSWDEPSLKPPPPGMYC